MNIIVITLIFVDKETEAQNSWVTWLFRVGVMCSMFIEINARGMKGMGTEVGRRRS